MKECAKQRRPEAARERRAAQEPGCDALENADRSDVVTNAEENNRVQDVERTDSEGAKQQRGARAHSEGLCRKTPSACPASSARTSSFTPSSHNPGTSPAASSAWIRDSISAASSAL